MFFARITSNCWTIAALVCVACSCQPGESAQSELPAPGAAAVPADTISFDFGDYPICPDGGVIPLHPAYESMKGEIPTAREATTEFILLDNDSGSAPNRWSEFTYRSPRKFLDAIHEFFHLPEEQFKTKHPHAPPWIYSDRFYLPSTEPANEVELFFSCFRPLDEDMVEAVFSIWARDTEEYAASRFEFAGLDMRIVLQPEGVEKTEQGQETWRIHSLRYRFHCRWGISNDGDFCICDKNLPPLPGPRVATDDGVEVVFEGGFYERHERSGRTILKALFRDRLPPNQRALLRSREDISSLCEGVENANACRFILEERLADIDFDTHAVYFSAYAGSSSPRLITEAYFVDHLVEIHDRVEPGAGCELQTADVRFHATLLAIDRSKIESLRLYPSEEVHSLSPPAHP